ncbi:hypothetical protein GH714_024152 [Hevea brasiliensis]|uniref:Uncharacterized protein n=1 Tax=Hevea brasiliensis TaxID=3981 RepID=A0A6A6KR01_HEVBR|nr:hypothetical protein GH714_024152 [Hevea brasiliensis]
MDGEAKLPVSAAPPPRNFVRPMINADTTSSSSSSFSSSSPPDFLKHVQAAFKRHRPLCTSFSPSLFLSAYIRICICIAVKLCIVVVTYSDNIGTRPTYSVGPRRVLVQQPETSKAAVSDVDPKTSMKKPEHVIPMSLTVKNSIIQTKNPVAVVRETQEESITPPSILGTTTKTFDESFNPSDVQRNQSTSVIDCKENNPMILSHVDGKRRVQFSVAKNANSQGADDEMATELEDLSSHIGSLALTEMEWDVSNQIEALNVINDESKHQNFQNMESDISLRTDVCNIFVGKKNEACSGPTASI